MTGPLPGGIPEQVNPAQLAAQFPIDPGNALVQGGRRPQAVWVAVQGADAQGPCLILTIRTDTATLTLRLSRENGEAFGAYVLEEARKVSALVVPGGPLG